MGVFDEVAVVDVEAKYSRFVSFLITVIKSMNPGLYRKLSMRTVKKATMYLINLIIFSMIIFMVVLIPFMMKLPMVLNEELVKIQDLKMSSSVDIVDTIKLNTPRITIGDNETYDGELLFATEHDVKRRNTMCMLSRIWCYFDNDPVVYDASTAKDFFDNEKKLGTSVFAIIILMLPGILIALFAFYLIKFALIIAILSLLMHALCLGLKYNIPWKKIIVIGIHSSTVMILLDVVLGFFIPINIIPLLLYILLFSVAIWFVGEGYTGRKWQN